MEHYVAGDPVGAAFYQLEFVPLVGDTEEERVACARQRAAARKAPKNAGGARNAPKNAGGAREVTPDTTVCCGCRQSIHGHGHNGRPLYQGQVCDVCNEEVILHRLG